MSQEPIGCNHQGKDNCYGQCALNTLPRMLPKHHLYYLVATARGNTGLYEFRNYRMGGKLYKVLLLDGETVRDWNAYPVNASNRPKPAPIGRWRWLPRD